MVDRSNVKAGTIGDFSSKPADGPVTTKSSRYTRNKPECDICFKPFRYKCHFLTHKDTVTDISSQESRTYSCDNFPLEPEMPAETLSERQNADSDPVINQLYAITEQPPTTSVIDVNELQTQKEHKETIKLLHELQYTFPSMPSWKSDAPCDNYFIDSDPEGNRNTIHYSTKLFAM